MKFQSGVDGLGVGCATGAGAGVVGVKIGATLLAIISAPFLATRIPISVVIEPVIKRTMSFNILVYAMSIGAIVFKGCCTNVTEYSMVNTRPPKTSITMQTTKAHTITSQKAISSSVVWNSARCRLSWFNFLLQDWGYKIFRTVLSELTVRLLATLCCEVLRVLAEVPIPVFTSSKATQNQQGQCEFFHVSFPFLPSESQGHSPS